MNKKKIVFFLVIGLLIFFIINIKVLTGLFFLNKASNQYKHHLYSGALENYTRSLDFLTGSNIKYNIGNTYYRIGENSEDIEHKFTNYIESLRVYKEILISNKNDGISEDTDTRFNYEYVKSKLEELSESEENDNKKDKQQEQQKQENQDQNEEDSGNENPDNKDNEQSEESDNSTNNNEEKNKNSNNLKDNESSENSENPTNTDGKNMSLYEKYEQIEFSEQDLENYNEYIKNLKEEEKYNREYLNNNKKEVDPFFDSFFDRGGEKDW